jgi:type IV secretion system protein VirB5
MKIIKKLLGMFALVVGFSAAPAHAGIPVIDAANLGQAIQQVIAWGQQYQQMTQQYQKLQAQFNSLNGSRGMASLVNNPALRKYLPSDYQTILNNGYGNSQAIRNAAKVYGVEQTSLGSATDVYKAFDTNAKQSSLNRATTEEAYKQAHQRFDTIQVLLDKVNDAPDAKDMADLQARIQAEQVMMQNEQVKLNMLAQLADAQRDLAAQRSTEMRMKAVATPNMRF